MRFGTQGAERHRAGRETLADFFDGFDFFDRDRLLFVDLEIE